MLKGKMLDKRVKSILAEDEKYQTSDLKLMARIWFEDISSITHGNPTSLDALNFLKLLRDGNLTKSESVTRCRRKIQAKFPELRVEKVYKGRKDKEKEMRSNSQYY
jgi:hypothetical protein|tara:strand:+ start:67 stop:384 length:318 start_codon:yes stop_codon:yes gene_type:complete